MRFVTGEREQDKSLRFCLNEVICKKKKKKTKIIADNIDLY